MNDRETLLFHSLRGLHLLEKAKKETVLSDLLGIQAQFSANPPLSLRLRAEDYAEETWADGLVKIWSHRGTMHVVSEKELGLHLSAAGYPAEFTDGAWGIPLAEARRWAGVIEEEIALGNATRDGLKAACLRRGMDEALLERVFHGWGGLIREMVYRGRIVCETGTKKTYALAQNVTFMPRDEARRIMLERYFSHFGPASVSDCRAFFGNWKKSELDPLLESLLPAFGELRVDGKRCYYRGALEESASLPDCVLLPGFDQLILGYKDRSRMMDAAHARKVTNAAGIVFPCVLLRGKLRARWKLEKGVFCVMPFETLLKKDEAAIRRAVRAAFGRIEIRCLSL